MPNLISTHVEIQPCTPQPEWLLHTCIRVGVRSESTQRCANGEVWGECKHNRHSLCPRADRDEGERPGNREADPVRGTDIARPETVGQRGDWD